jgi:hypothetical protein
MIEMIEIFSIRHVGRKENLGGRNEAKKNGGMWSNPDLAGVEKSYVYSKK